MLLKESGSKTFEFYENGTKVRCRELNGMKLPLQIKLDNSEAKALNRADKSRIEDLTWFMLTRKTWNCMSKCGCKNIYVYSQR